MASTGTRIPLRLALCAAVTLAALAAPAAALDWPRFRGPNGAGVADDGALPATLAPETALWKVALPPGYSSPVAIGERIFLTAHEGEQLLVLALDRRSGRELWRREAPRARREKLDRRNDPAAASVAADASRLVVFFGEYGLLAFDHDGRELWRTPLGPFDNVYGMGASPVLAGGLVVLACDQSTGSFVAAFDAASGRERWRTPRPLAVSGHSTPVLLEREGAPAQVVLPGSFRLDAYELETGRSAWFADGLPSEMKAGAVLDGSRVLVAGYGSPLNEPGQHPKLPPYAEWRAANDKDGDGRVTRPEADKTSQEYFPFIDLDRDGVVSESEWRTNLASMAAENGLLAFRGDLAGDVTRSALVWTHRRSVPQLPTPVLYRGVLYMINDAGILTTLDAERGTVHHQGRLPGAVDSYFASPVAGDGKLYFVSKGGIASVLGAGREPSSLAVTDFGEEVAATPAIQDGRIYVRTRGALYCFSGSRPDGRPAAGAAAPSSSSPRE